MSLNEEVAAEIQKLSPSSVVELFVLDCTSLGGDVFRFHNGTNKLNQNIEWQGEEYVRFPILVTGFEVTGQGQFPRPTVTVSNALSAITTVLLQYGDLLGAKFTRKRTFLKYLDAINFPGNVNPDADPTVEFPDDVFYVDRKVVEDRDQVQFELASVADLQGVSLPKRTIIQNVCPWLYRGPECGFVGIPLYDQNDDQIPHPTSVEAIAMMDARDGVIAAEAALVIAQAALVAAANAVTAAQQYSQTVNYSRTAPKYYVQGVFFGPPLAYWNDVQVTIGTEYTIGEFVTEEITQYIGTIRYYKIVRNTRDEGALATAVSNYNTALSTRNTAQSNLTIAQDDLDDAIALVPADDQVYIDDRCGKRLTSCKLRFGENNPLPFGGFPGASR